MSKIRKHVPKSTHAIPHTEAINSFPRGEPHIIYPDLIRQQSRLESFGRTVRNLVPSAFSNPTPTEPTSTAARSTYGSYASTPTLESEDVRTAIPEESRHDNNPIWSHWISFHHSALLLVAYRLSGFHIWDVTNLDAVKEKLHLPSIGPVSAATILSDINASGKLLLLVGSGIDTALAIYSLETHTTITRISVPHAQTLQANSRFICVGGTSTIHIISANSDYSLLYTLPSSALAPSSTPPIFALSQSRLLAYAAAPPPTHRQQQQPSPPKTSSYPPSNAFASPSPIPPSTSPLASGLATGMAVVGSGMLSGAKILGSGVLEGVKMGMNAAGYRTTTSTTTGTVPDGSIQERGGLFSRSAPTGNASPLSARGHSRRASGNVNARSAVSNTVVSPGIGGTVTGGVNEGSWITIVDLQSLIPSSSSTSPSTHEPESADGEFMYSPPHRSSSFHANIPTLRTLSKPSSQSTPPHVLAEFQYATASASSAIPSSLRTLGRYSPSSKGALGRYSPSASGTSTLAPLGNASAGTSSVAVGAESVTTMRWNAEGTMLAVGGSEGGAVKVFKLSRKAKSRRPSADGEKESDTKMIGHDAGANIGLGFEMLRGVSPSSIRSIEWSDSGLWSGFVSGNGTLHMFAVSPGGSAVDELSHLTGKTRNTAPRRSGEPSIRLSAVARLRRPLLQMSDEPSGPSRPSSTSRRISDQSLPSLDELSAMDAPLPSSQTTIPTRTPSFTFISNAHSLASKRIPIPRDGSSRPITPSDPSVIREDNHDPRNSVGFQDLLVFDPAEGVLVLWRCTLRASSTAIMAPSSERPLLERHPSVVGDAPAEPTGQEGASGSIVGSLPIGGVLSNVARMAGLSRMADGAGGVMSALTGGSGLVGEGAVIVSWDLKRGENWGEVKDSFAEKTKDLGIDAKAPYLSHAELTTFPTRSSYVKRPIYLSRQFNFSVLTSDYHALLRRHDFDPPSIQISLRKDSVVVRSGEDLHGHDAETSLPSDFDSQADFLGTNTGPLDLTDSPLLGGHLGLVADHPPFSSSLASTSTSSPSRGARKAIGHSFDDSISSAIGSNLQLDASYSPSGSSSDMASPGRVIPMAPNGRPGSAGGGVNIAGGLDAVVRSTTRVGKEMWGGLTSARSPRLMPTTMKRTSATGDLLKFDEEEEMFMVDDLEVAGDASNTSPSGNAMKKDASEATINPITWSVESGTIYPRMTDSGMTVGPPANATSTSTGAATPGSTTAEDGTWVAQPEVYDQAVEEDARYDDVTRILEEEREERKRLQARMGALAGDAAKDGGVKGKSPGKKSSARRKKKGDL